MIQLRRANRKDNYAVLKLCVGSIKTVASRQYSSKQIDAWSGAIQNSGRLDAAITDQFFLVAEEDETLVGFGSLQNGDHVDFLYVHKDHQGRGIAQMLLEELLKEAFRLNKPRVTSNVSQTARPFFERKGFTVVTEKVQTLRGVKINNFLMEKIISSS